MNALDYLKLLKKYPIFVENEVMIDEAIEELELLYNNNPNCSYKIEIIQMSKNKGNNMTKEKANEWIENTFSDWTKEDDRQESIFYLVKRIYNDLENRSCENCKFKYVVDSMCTECRCNESPIEYLDLDTFPFFGCSEWEPK